jgi:4'-phosphopantetheinyl transferase
VRGEADLPGGQDWLTEVEARRAAGMRFTKRRTEYLVRRYAGKCAVAAATGLGQDVASLARIGVLNAATGAPYVVVDGRRLGLDISLTDRAGWAVGLVAEDLSAVGCDLEIVEPRSAGFVRDFLTPAEQQLVATAAESGGPDGRDAAANLVWSAKESALKVMRTGLRADTRTVEVSLRGPVDRVSAGTVDGQGPTGADGSWQELVVATGCPAGGGATGSSCSPSCPGPRRPRSRPGSCPGRRRSPGPPRSTAGWATPWSTEGGGRGREPPRALPHPQWCPARRPGSPPPEVLRPRGLAALSGSRARPPWPCPARAPR